MSAPLPTVIVVLKVTTSPILASFFDPKLPFSATSFNTVGIVFFSVISTSLSVVSKLHKAPVEESTK